MSSPDPVLVAVDACGRLDVAAREAWTPLHAAARTLSAEEYGLLAEEFTAVTAPAAAARRDLDRFAASGVGDPAAVAAALEAAGEAVRAARDRFSAAAGAREDATTAARKVQRMVSAARSTVAGDAAVELTTAGDDVLNRAGALAGSRNWIAAGRLLAAETGRLQDLVEALPVDLRDRVLGSVAVGDRVEALRRRGEEAARAVAGTAAGHLQDDLRRAGELFTELTQAATSSVAGNAEAVSRAQGLADAVEETLSRIEAAAR